MRTEIYANMRAVMIRLEKGLQFYFKNYRSLKLQQEYSCLLVNQSSNQFTSKAIPILSRFCRGGGRVSPIR